MNAESLAPALTAVVGAEPAAPPAGYRVAGPEPRWAVHPATAEQVAAVLALAQAEQVAVVPRGQGSKDGLGAPLRQALLVLETGRLNQVVAYNPADLTVTVQAGMAFAELQRILARSGQFLPLDPPGWQQATVGGIVAAGLAGPLRLAYGSPRDLVLGLQVALVAGHTIRTGSRVVKNVAGYDLTKLFTGSLGTLGVITEVTFKVRPIPPARRTLMGAFRTLDQAALAARSLLMANLEPAAMELLLPGTAGENGTAGAYGLAVALAESVGAVRYQVEQIRGHMRAEGATAVHELVDADGDRLWAQLSAAAGPEEIAVASVAVPPARIRDALAHAAVAAPGLPGFALSGHGGPGTGSLRLHFRAAEPGRFEPEVQIPALAEYLARLRADVEMWGGSMTLEAAVPTLKSRFPVWGKVGPALRLMRELKERFDPGGVLNPGRFAGEI